MIKMKKKYIQSFENYLKIISLILLSGLFFTSCKDSYGTDPLVKITPINHDGGNDSAKIDHKFPISDNWTFFEYYERDKTGYSFLWNQNIHEIRNNFLIDTTNNQIKIWIDYQIETNIPDNAMKFREDRIVSFSFKVDSLVLDLSSQNKNYSDYYSLNSEIQIKEIMMNRKTVINNKEIGMIFTVNKNPNSKNIEGFINLDIFPFFHFQTYKFQAFFEGIIPQ